MVAAPIPPSSTDRASKDRASGERPIESAPASPFERAFERKVRLSRWALLFEQLWPRAWLLLGLAGLFIVASLAGLWPNLPELPHKIVLALFGLAFVAGGVALARVRWPSRDEAIHRVEAVSGIKHRPASSYEDSLTLGAEDPRTAALWRVHRQRLATLLQKLRVGRPEPRTDRYDPFALRALLLLGVLALVIIVGDSASDRLRSAFRFGALAKGAEARLDAWITPPAYTGRANRTAHEGQARRALRGARSQRADHPRYGRRHRRAVTGGPGRGRQDRAAGGAGRRQCHRCHGVEG
jgi:Domain of unknown function (DUF4175)